MLRLLLKIPLRVVRKIFSRSSESAPDDALGPAPRGEGRPLDKSDRRPW